MVKDIVERTHGEPIKFKMGFLGIKVSSEKKLVMNYEVLLRAVFIAKFLFTL